MTYLYIALAVIALGIVVVVVSSIIDNNKVIVKTYNFENSKIDSDCKIVFLSDLHGNNFGNHNDKLIDMITKINPDLVLVGGDMITATKDKVATTNWDNALSLLAGINQYPICYGMGNHEYRMYLYREDFDDAFDVYMDKLDGLKINILNNASYLFEEFNINVSGISIDRKYYKRFEKNVMNKEYVENCLKDISADAYNIMLAHNPEYFDTYSRCADLTLSGHVHGGIIKLPFLGGVISPRLTLFPKYDGGLFANDSGAMVISRGLGSHTLPFRVFNPCELVVINLKKI